MCKYFTHVYQISLKKTIIRYLDLVFGIFTHCGMVRDQPDGMIRFLFSDGNRIMYRVRSNYGNTHFMIVLDEKTV